MLKNRVDGQWWVEPFVGGANIIDKVKGNRLGADSNSHVIDALCFIRDGQLPRDNNEFTEGMYDTAAILARENRLDGYAFGMQCYALIAFSFGAKWVGGWSRGKNSKGEQRDYVDEQYRANMKQKPLLKGVWFEHVDYENIEIPEKSIVYCDSPYKGTTGYKYKFDHDKYFEWCRLQVKAGHQVFISEYSAPADFICVWQKELKVSVAKVGKQKNAIEKLFVHESQVESVYESLY